VGEINSAIPPNHSRYKYRRSVPLQHSVCCPLNRTIIMKPVVLTVLLLLAVASIVSGTPTESGSVSGDPPVASIESGDTKEGGKSRNGNETYLAVILQKLQIYKIISLLNYEIRQEVWRRESKTPGILVLRYRQKCRYRSSCSEQATGWISVKSRFHYHHD